MSKFSRRQLFTAGLYIAGGASGLAAATMFARRYGLVPPDCGGIYGPGETLSYAAHRLLASLHTHSPARDRVVEAEKAKERSRLRFG